nr:MAG TPA: hypothetical protein [Caudoviricetes sp.]
MSAASRFTFGVKTNLSVMALGFVGLVRWSKMFAQIFLSSALKRSATAPSIRLSSCLISLDAMLYHLLSMHLIVIRLFSILNRNFLLVNSFVDDCHNLRILGMVHLLGVGDIPLLTKSFDCIDRLRSPRNFRHVVHSSPLLLRYNIGCRFGDIIRMCFRLFLKIRAINLLRRGHFILGIEASKVFGESISQALRHRYLFDHSGRLCFPICHIPVVLCEADFPIFLHLFAIDLAHYAAPAANKALAGVYAASTFFDVLTPAFDHNAAGFSTIIGVFFGSTLICVVADNHLKIVIELNGIRFTDKGVQLLILAELHEKHSLLLCQFGFSFCEIIDNGISGQFNMSISGLILNQPDGFFFHTHSSLRPENRFLGFDNTDAGDENVAFGRFDQPFYSSKVNRTNNSSENGDRNLFGILNDNLVVLPLRYTFHRRCRNRNGNSVRRLVENLRFLQS